MKLIIKLLLILVFHLTAFTTTSTSLTRRRDVERVLKNKDSTVEVLTKETLKKIMKKLYDDDDEKKDDEKEKKIKSCFLDQDFEKVSQTYDEVTKELFFLQGSTEANAKTKTSIHDTLKNFCKELEDEPPFTNESAYKKVEKFFDKLTKANNKLNKRLKKLNKRSKRLNHRK